MSLSQRMYNILICFVLPVVLVSCGGGGSTKGSKSVITIIPNKPIVITGPTKDTQGTEIPGAWYRFSVGIDNPTDEQITVVAVEVTTTAVDSQGQSVTTTATFSPSQFNFQLNESTQCEYSTFGTFPAGSSGNILWLNGAGDFDTGCDRIAGFIIGGNPTGPNGKNFRYKVKMKPLGWFGPADLSDLNASFDRYEKTVNFFTQ